MAKRYAMLSLRARTPEAEPVTEINIIPVIDVSLVLLVILFVSAPLMSYPSLPVELPRATSAESQERFIPVTRTARGELAVGGDRTDWEGLPALLSAAIRKLPDAPVVMRVDKSVPYRDVERLIAAAKEAGARSIALGTESVK